MNALQVIRIGRLVTRRAKHLRDGLVRPTDLKCRVRLQGSDRERSV